MAEGVIATLRGYSINVRTEDADGAVSRRVLVPGAWDAGKWVPKDLVGEPAEVYAAAEGWTPDVIATYQATFPWVEPPPKPFADLSRPAFLFMASKIGASEPVVLGLIDAMPSTTPAEADAKTLAKIVYQNQQVFKRDNALLKSLAQAAKIPDATIDAAWRAAEQIKW